MAYDDVKKEFGREPVYYIEIDADYCGNTYGTGLCTAIGTGPFKCFNTFKTCQDTPHFANQIKVYRFASKRIDELQQAGDAVTFPTLQTIGTTPTKLDPSNGLGARSTLKLSVADHPWTDAGIDPYLSERTEDADAIGSFWGKWLARNPYYEGRGIRVWTGYLTDEGLFDQSNFIERAYLLHKISGPDASGKVMIEAKDPLKRADNEKSQWPPAPEVTLTADIGDSTTIIAVDDSAPISAWLARTPTQEYIRIDDEIMRVTAAAGNSLTVVRASMPLFYQANSNIAEDHDDGASVQLCYLYENERIDHVIEQLLNEASGIPLSFLPVADWQAVILDSGYETYEMNTLLVETKGVKDLLQELTKLNVMIWWDERAQQVKMGTLLPTSASGDVYNEDTHIIDKSVGVTLDVKGRLSRVWFAYGHRNPTQKLDELVNFSAVEIRIDDDAESENEYGQKRVHKIMSRWLTGTQRPIAGEISGRILVDKRDTKATITIKLDPKDDDQWTGDTITVETRQRQDKFGRPVNANYLILQATENLKANGVEYSYVLQEQVTFDRTGVITPDTNPEVELVDGGEGLTDGGEELHDGALEPTNKFPDYSDASQNLKNHYAFIAYDGPPAGFLDGTVAYQIS